MGLIKTYRCLKCDSVFEGILDICAQCGGRGAVQSGIASMIAYSKPNGFARSSTTPHSAKSFDRSMQQNFDIMRISNCTHKDGVPNCTFTRKAKSYNKGGYMSVPASYGQSGPVKAYTSFTDMAKDGYHMGPMMADGRPFQVPQVHPEIKSGAPIRSEPMGLLPGTQITARSTGRQ